MGFWDGSGISWTVCKQSAPRSRHATTPAPHHSIFTGRMLFHAQPTVSKHWRHEATDRTCMLLTYLILIHSKVYILNICVYHIAWGTYVYLPKVADFTYLTCISHPHWGWPWSNFKMFFGVRELESEESLGYLMALFALSRIQPFWHNSSLWQTDGQTQSHKSELVRYKACLLNNCTLFLLHFVVMWGYFHEWNCTWYSDICFDV